MIRTPGLIRVSSTLSLALLLSVFLSGCAAGSPGVTLRPTDTAVAVAARPAAATPSPLAVGGMFSRVALAPDTQGPTATASPTSTTTPPPTLAPEVTPGATKRPAPPPDDGSGISIVVDRGTSGRMEIALTFDAGADRGYAEQILDTLDQYGIKGSFGMTGHWADENPDLVKRMVDEGHMIFNHTWTHRSFTGYSTADWDAGVLTAKERRKELRDTAKLIAKLTDGYATAPYWRPPYGDYDDTVLVDVGDFGYYVTVMWTCDTLGWNGASVDQIVERCGDSADPGDIILMHVGAESLDAEALPQMIETLQAQGYSFVTIEELLQP